MADQRRGLGRGLSALLGEADDASAAETPRPGDGRDVPIELIGGNPDQPRRDFGESDLEELAVSIREHGVLQPILVRPTPGEPGRFQIVAGERRWRAAQRAGLREMPVVIRELDDLRTLEISIIENVQRVDLNAIEEAFGYRDLVERFGRTQEEIGRIVGKSRSHVANALRLLGLPEAVQAALREGRLSAGHARALAAAPDPAALAQVVLVHRLNVRQTETLARRAQTPTPAPVRPAAPAKDADTRALEDDLSEALGLSVEIVDREGAGQMRIRYDSLEQLDELCRRLTRGGADIGDS
jgi:ParB family chromosome partitioning protein